MKLRGPPGVRWSWNVGPVNPDDPAFEPATANAWLGTI
jgi:hypothetical protein